MNRFDVDCLLTDRSSIQSYKKVNKPKRRKKKTFPFQTKSCKKKRKTGKKLQINIEPFQSNCVVSSWQNKSFHISPSINPHSKSPLPPPPRILSCSPRNFFNFYLFFLRIFQFVHFHSIPFSPFRMYFITLLINFKVNTSRCKV